MNGLILSYIIILFIILINNFKQSPFFFLKKKFATFEKILGNFFGKKKKQYQIKNII